MYISLYAAGFQPDDKPLGNYLIIRSNKMSTVKSLLNEFSIYGYKILIDRPNGVIQTYNKLQLFVENNASLALEDFSNYSELRLFLLEQMLELKKLNNKQESKATWIFQ